MQIIDETLCSGQEIQEDIKRVHLNTGTISESDRFEVWRSYFRRTFLDIPDPRRATLFNAEGDIITRSDGVMFTAGHCEATDNHLSGDISDFILLGSILSGESVYTHADDDPIRVPPGSGLSMLSPQDKVVIRNHYHRYALIIVPKKLARVRLGTGFAERGRSVFTFPQSPLGQMLNGLLRLTAQRARSFDEAAARTSLSSLVDFALATVLEEQNLQEERLPDADRAYFSAVCTVIRNHIHDPEINSDLVAYRLGISRSNLYRILTGMGETSGHLIRRIRLEKAQQLMIDTPGCYLGEIAARCGYSSPSAFARAFRAATGMTATDWRQVHARAVR